MIAVGRKGCLAQQDVGGIREIILEDLDLGLGVPLTEDGDVDDRGGRTSDVRFDDQCVRRGRNVSSSHRLDL